MKILTLKSIKNKNIILSVNELYRDYQADLIFPTTPLRNKFFNDTKFIKYHNSLHVEEHKYNDCLIMTESSIVYGIAFIEPSTFETDIFGKKMGMLHIKLKDDMYNTETSMHEFIKALNTLVENLKYEHISIKVAINNISLINSLQEFGYRYIASLATLVYAKDNTSTRKLRCICKVQAANRNNAKKMIEISENAFFGTRFTNDPSLSKKKCSMLYREWINNCFDLGWASKVLVALNSRDEVVGFITYLIDQELKRRSNITKVGRGLLACLPDARGAFVSLFQTSLGLAVEEAGADFIEYTTQLENLKMISMYNRLGLRLSKIEHILRKELNR